MHAGAVEIRTLDGVSVNTRRWDPQRNGHVGAQPASPLLLVHGLGANTVSWLPVGQALADRRNGPVIALDLAGFGYTRAVGTNATIHRNAGLVVAALEEFGPSVVFGNSMGGVISVKVSALRPDLVQGLVLVNPALRPVFGSPQWRQAWLLSPMVFPRVGTRVIGGRATQLGAEGMVDGTLRLVLEDPTALDPRIRDEFVAIATDRGAYPEAAPARTPTPRARCSGTSCATSTAISRSRSNGIPGSWSSATATGSCTSAARRHSARATPTSTSRSSRASATRPSSRHPSSSSTSSTSGCAIGT